MNRLFVIDKPSGLTSHDVVDRVRHVLRMRRVGHAGTLDPSATGVLLIMTGYATRLAQFLVETEKEYAGQMVLGVATDTQDADGKVIATGDIAGIDRTQVESACAAFRGDIEQIPPMMSAVKRNGERLYVLARKGIAVEREPRPVRVERFEIMSFAPPLVGFEVVCSKGTYVRTLVADVGERLGSGAHVSELRRTRVGRFHSGTAIPLAEFERATGNVETLGYSLFEAVQHFTSLHLNGSEADRISEGGGIEVESARLESPSEYLRLTPDGQRLLAIAAMERGEDGAAVTVRPIRVFPGEGC
jgi:tRNA pseudouridine55 synthase